VTTLARAVFAALVVATFGAFFAAQRLKSEPPEIQRLGVTPLFSPNQDGRLDVAIVSFRLVHDDTVDLTIVDREGDPVRELVEDRELAEGEQLRERWDGRDDAGRVAPDGVYRARLVLRDQGRSVVLPRNIELDTTPPSPRVLSIGPDRAPGAELLPRPDGQPARIRFSAPGRRPELEVWRTDGTPRRITALEVPEPGALRDGVGVTTWDGTRAGRRVAPGTFVVVVRSRDRAGNIGSSVPARVLAGRPRRGEELPGRGGITVRYLAVQPPLLPVGAGRPIEVGVDARGERWNWTLRRAGSPEVLRRGTRTRGGPFRLRAPDGESGLFLFEVRTRTRRTQVPVAVDGRRDRRVLVVLPATTWQGRSRVDDDGDGLADTLDRGVPVRLARVFAGGLPPGVARNEAPLLAYLDRQRLRYDLTTDVALAVGRGPALDGRRGVLLAGDTLWLTEDVRRRLRGFVAQGGTLASFGTRSLRGEVRQTPRRLLDATPLAPADLFGARHAPVRRGPVDVQIRDDDERLQLFAGGAGLFPRVAAFEATVSVGPEARLLSAAVTPDGDEVITAARFGRGLVLRPGIPAFATRAGEDPASAELLRRMWTLLRTG
jgi:hypothetical protein